jgi:PAS domain S-box-containing protein
MWGVFSLYLLASIVLPGEWQPNNSLVILGVAIPLQGVAFVALLFLSWMGCTFNRALKSLQLSEDELKYKRAQFNLVLKGASAGLWEWDMTRDTMNWSPQMRILLGIGRSQKDFIWEDFISRVHPEDAEWVTTHLHQHLYQRAGFDVECRLRHRSGNYIWVQCFGQAIWDDNNTPLSMNGVIINIQKQKNNEAQIKHLTQYNQNILRSLDQSAIIAITDHKGFITHVNERFCDVSGYSRHEILGKTHAMIKSGLHHNSFYEDMWDTIISGKTWQGEVCNKRKNGELYWVDSTIVPFTDENNEPYQYVAIRFEVTERKKVEADLIDAKNAAEHASQIKGQFLASVSHELRTPLNGVIGAGYLLQQSDLSSDQQATCAMLQSSAKNLQRLIDDVLDFEELTDGNVTVKPKTFSLGVAVEEWISPLLPKATGKGLALNLNMDDNLPLLLIGDEHRYRLIVEHLVDNAIKFTSQGSINVSLSLTNRYTASHNNTANDRNNTSDKTLVTISLKVEDTGIGMDKHHVEKLFDHFTQGDSSLTREHQGLGLGLAIVKQLVELLDGDIQIQSRLGEGSTFTVDVPFELTSQPTNNKPLSLEDKSRGKHSPRILYVEDNPVNQKITQRILGKAGIEVLLADNGEEGLAVLNNSAEHIDLVLMDCQMPIMDGYEATRKIRQLEKATPANWPYQQPLPIIALTANAQSDADQMCRNAGMNEYIAKPVSPCQLIEKISDFIEIPSPENLQQSAAGQES